MTPLLPRFPWPSVMRLQQDLPVDGPSFSPPPLCSLSFTGLKVLSSKVPSSEKPICRHWLSHSPILVSPQHLSLTRMILYVYGFLVHSWSLFPLSPSLPPKCESYRRKALAGPTPSVSGPLQLLTIYLLSSLNKIMFKSFL